MMKNIDLRIGDCLEVLKEIEDNSIDSIVTDPPYGLNFMGKKWDYQVPSIEIWKECFRVLKAGGHLLSFAGSRTYHRIAINIEDAGFEIRDQIMWIYGSGFPKSHNIGKNIEKIKVGGIKNLKQIGTKLGIKVETGTSGFSYSKEYVAGKSMGGKQIGGQIPVYEISNDYEGWGTALKPAHEPICMARKPLSEKTVAENVLRWGTGGINIDGCRVGTDDTRGKASLTALGQNSGWNAHINKEVIAGSECGRFPANLIHDGSEEVLEFFPNTHKAGNKKDMNKNLDYNATSYKFSNEKNPAILGDKGGSAARFFYCAKASKKDRNEGLDSFVDQDRTNYGGFHSDKGFIENNRNPENRQPNKNNHPTVKPTDLMLYLIRLVTPKGGITLDPFMGSGSSGKAAVRGDFQFVGIEREAEYFEIAEARIEHEQKKPNQIKIFE